VLEGAIELQLIVEQPAGCEMNLSQPLPVAKSPGDRLDLFEDAKALFVTGLQPYHLHFGEAEVDPLPLPLVRLRKTVQAFDNSGAVSQGLD
jgi:hypothetical protein